MAEAKKAASKVRRYEVLISFSALNKGDRFTDHAFDGADQWAQQHVQTGYLREITEEEAPDAGQGEDRTG